LIISFGVSFGTSLTTSLTTSSGFSSSISLTGAFLTGVFFGFSLPCSEFQSLKLFHIQLADLGIAFQN